MTKKRIYGLDVLRALAILTVILRHMFSILGVPAPILLVEALNINGVFMFFVLSGYLIGGILLRTLTDKSASFINLAAFWRDRWLRTLPAYYCVLVTIVIIAIIYNNKSVFDFRFLFFFSENLTDGKFPRFGESWSLAVEEWFYLVIPLMLFLGVKVWPLKKIIPVIITIVFLFSNAVRVIWIHKYGIDDLGPNAKHLFKNIAYSVPTRIDSIMYGVLGAYLHFYEFKFWKKKNILFAIGVAGFVFNHFYRAFTDFNMYDLYFQKQVELLFILMTIPKLAAIQDGKGAIARIITFIATISYSIYLVHDTLFLYAIRPRFPNNIWIQYSAYFLWAFGGGYLLYATVEKWGLRVRQKLKGKTNQSDYSLSVKSYDPGNRPSHN